VASLTRSIAGLQRSHKGDQILTDLGASGLCKSGTAGIDVVNNKHSLNHCVPSDVASCGDDEEVY